MAARSQCRSVTKDKNAKLNPKPSQNVLADEIALRDEIFELKREILLLRKANERNLIKVRKYEDEAKKKDRQIEQLMDPVKNGDVRKLLSTKGAALLLNLREQNNALIQMVLAKDMQIRKLLSEIKTSKLYTSTRKAESYRHEIDRLRNLLIKSQNTVKESQDVHQRRSACADGASVREVTLSSDQSSPRDLEELHFTIQSLEMHMKYSNELLARKNEQIIQLTDQLNSYQCSTCRRNAHPRIFLESAVKSAPENTRKNSDFSEGDRPTSGEYATIGPTSDKPHNPRFLARDSDQELRESKPLAAAGAGGFHDRDGDPKGKEDAAHAGTGQESCGGEGSLPDNNALQMRNAKPITCVNGTKTELGRHFAPGDSGVSGLHRILEKASASSLTEEESDVDTEEFELMEKKIENDQTEIESPVKLTPQRNGCSRDLGLERLPSEEEPFLVRSGRPDSGGGPGLAPEETGGGPWGSSKAQEAGRGSCTDSFELENAGGQGGDRGTPDNCCLADTGHSDFIRDPYPYTSDSSLDSQTNAGNPVQVEAEINHDSEAEGHGESGDEGQVIANENRDGDGDGDDDDDVITG